LDLYGAVPSLHPPSIIACGRNLTRNSLSLYHVNNGGINIGGRNVGGRNDGGINKR
jgi:hypothetical protein